jgi:hypothetical protein
VDGGGVLVHAMDARIVAGLCDSSSNTPEFEPREKIDIRAKPLLRAAEHRDTVFLGEYEQYRYAHLHVSLLCIGLQHGPYLFLMGPVTLNGLARHFDGKDTWHAGFCLGSFQRVRIILVLAKCIFSLSTSSILEVKIRQN